MSSPGTAMEPELRPATEPSADPDPPRRPVIKQSLIVLAGVLSAAIMVTLGLWQLNVYTAEGRHRAAARADAPPVELVSVAPPGQQVTDGYGRTVRFTGRYDPAAQQLLPADEQGERRVLTAFRLDSGGTVAVVRGITRVDEAPDPPQGRQTQTGILLPSEGSDQQAPPGSDPTGVSLPLLAQRWGPDLVNGYVTLDPASATPTGLSPARVDLPSGSGRLRNGAYAMQWWLFAAFAIGMSVKMARDLGREAQQDGDVESQHGRRQPDRDDD